MLAPPIRARLQNVLPAFGLLALLAACSVGPDYTKPSAPVPARFKESKDWRPARPRDGADRGAWWSVYRDAQLNRLLPLVEVNNQNVAAAVAAHDQAEALIREAQASLFPTVSGQYSVTRSGEGSRVLSTGGAGTTSAGTNLNHAFARTLFYPQGAVGWTLDVWGKVRRQIESDVAQTQADSALLANATLSAQAQLAVAYFNLRYEDSLKDLLLRTATAYQETARITKNQYDSGTVSKADLITAETQLLNTQAQAIATETPRQQFEHAIAVLTGRPPAEVTVPRGALHHNPPATPAGLPSTLLERRPDIAAAERTVAQQNALIGVAVAAYYPSLTLSAAGGFQGPNAFPFLAAYQIWSLGAAAADPLFDAGLRSAQVDLAKATWRQSVAAYRQTVLTAFQQVEDQLVALRVFGKELRVQEKARDEAAEAVKVYLNQYRAGTVAFTTVVVAEATLLADEEAVLATEQALFVASVTLVEALGGGYDAQILAAEQAPPLIEAVERSSPIPPL